MKKRDIFFKLYGSKSDPTPKANKHNNFKKVRNSVIPKVNTIKTNNIKETWA